jgi:hypothetical protein
LKWYWKITQIGWVTMLWGSGSEKITLVSLWLFIQGTSWWGLLVGLITEYWLEVFRFWFKDALSSL